MQKIILKKDGKKFEIACYKNKVIDWRNGIENRLEEVLQIHDIFANVERGELADKKLIEERFPNMTKDEVIEMILDRGEMQLGEKEREVMLDNIFKEILTIIQNKLIHPETKRPYSIDAMKAAMKSINFNVKLNQGVKRQALACMKKLQNKYLVSRANMLIQIKIPQDNWSDLKAEFST